MAVGGYGRHHWGGGHMSLGHHVLVHKVEADKRGRYHFEYTCEPASPLTYQDGSCTMADYGRFGKASEMP